MVCELDQIETQCWNQSSYNWKCLYFSRVSQFTGIQRQQYFLQLGAVRQPDGMAPLWTQQEETWVYRNVILSSFSWHKRLSPNFIQILSQKCLGDKPFSWRNKLNIFSWCLFLQTQHFISVRLSILHLSAWFDNCPNVILVDDDLRFLLFLGEC